MRHAYNANTVTLNLVQGLNIAVPSKIKMLKQVQHDGFGKLGLGQ
jgi:hypothetical protein